MDIEEKVLEVMRAEGQPLNAEKIAELGGFDRKWVFRPMPTAIPSRWRPMFRSDADRHSDGKPTAVPVMPTGCL